jgi:type I restriction enzyme R subunit
MVSESKNFRHLTAFDAQVARLGTLAERYFQEDPNTALIKLRQFAEALAQLTAANLGLFTDPTESQVDLLRRLKQEGALSTEVSEYFHYVRKLGNEATHHHGGTHGDALNALKFCHQLGIWFHRTFSEDRKFSTGPFVPPASPSEASDSLQAELDRLRADLASSLSAAEKTKDEIARQADALLSSEQRAAKEAEERVLWEQLATEAEEAKVALQNELRALQERAMQTLPDARISVVRAAQQLGATLSLDEAATRALIDQQLHDRGWEAGTETLRFSKGTRPVRGRNLAIAEWPTENGPADYALFIGTSCIAVVEAKKKNKNVSAVIDQAERYSRGMRAVDGITLPGGPWESGSGDTFKVPFVFSTNGRPYLKQLETESGIWFRDARKPTNHRRALADWYTPDGLVGLLEIDREQADDALRSQPLEFGFPLRPYQKKAIQAIETAIEDDQRRMLVAMATGTGKTKLAIALLYRLLTAKRFRRVCFVVDLGALGEQVAGEFKTTKVVNVRTFADTFGLKELTDITPDAETKVHICTIQGLVKRVLFATEPGDVPPVDQYDLMVVDECHRGYLLDRELSDAELEFRSQDDYISKYRRVLEHFDAVKIGLTATPALHTREIFGPPIFTYGYREAVIDGYLIDHEPPVQITTVLAQAGISFKQGETVEVLHTATGQVDAVDLPDELHYDVDDFNRKVITQPFNRVVAEALADYIDPAEPGKTLIFAATDAHADIVVDQLKRVFAERFGDVDDAAIRKITGSVDRARDAIRAYRNDPLPKIAVTVDLLTTGVDVPSITNIVFLRRVNSRILYEQMLGRATRQCPEIGKETFRIFDAVDLYRTLEPVTTMKPVVVNPAITLTQLFEELPTVIETTHREAIVDQIIVKLRMRLPKLPDDVREAYQAQTGERPEDTLERLRATSADEVAIWTKNHPYVGRLLDWTDGAHGGAHLPISTHPDELVSIVRGYGSGTKPEDFLESFTSFIRNHVNDVAALTVVALGRF